MSTTQTRTSASISYPVERVAWRHLWLMGLIAIGASVVVNSLIRIIALALLPISADFMQLQMPPIVIVFTIIGTLGALLTFALMNRFARNPIQLFRIVALIVVLVSFLPDLLLLSGPGGSIASVTTLMMMHIVTCLICIAAFTGFSRTKAQ